jgi:hypothetical protein
MDPIVQWSIWERELTADRERTRPYLRPDEAPLTATFRHAASGSRVTVEGFWDGGRTWRVRFAPGLAGAWEWETASDDPALAGQGGAFEVRAPGPEEIAANPNLHGHVRVAPDGRHFVHADGAPFLLLGDTNWAMNTERCGLGDGDGPFFLWLRDRQAKDYSAVMTECMEIDQPNEGGYPFPGNTSWPGNGRFDDLNPAYFAGLDRRMAAVWEAGLAVCLHPTWIGKQVGMAPEDAAWFSRYIMARYGAYNLIWSLSGEYQYAYTHSEIRWTRADWRALGETVAAANAYGHPISVHPSGRQNVEDPIEWGEEAHQASSGGEFHDEPWLDHNWLQTGHSLDRLWRVPQRVAENYARTPAKPVLHAEGFYERQNIEGASARMVRWQAWSAFLNGAAGHVYGAAGVWQFYDPSASVGIGADRTNSRPWHGQSWREALDYAGGKQLAHLLAFFRALPWHRLEPHREWLRVRGVPADVQSLTDPHCAAIPGEVVVVYIPAGNSGKRIEILHVGDRDYVAQWYDPRSGAYTPASDRPIRGDRRDGAWRAPSVYRHSDWVLLLTAAN